MPASGSNRKSILGVVLVGVAGAILVPLFIVIARSRVEDSTRASLVRTVRAERQALSRRVERVWRDVEARTARPLDPRLAASWTAIAADLEASLLEAPFVESVSVKVGGELLHFGRGDVPTGLDSFFENTADDAFFERDHHLYVTIAYPKREVSRAALVSAALTPPELKDRDRLLDFVMFGAGGLGVVLYLLAALVFLVDRIQTRLLNQEREKATRLRAMGEVAGGIAHEVRNPLNAISLSLQYMERLQARGDHKPSPADFARIHLELGKIRKIVDNFVKFARTRDLVVGQLDMGTVVDEVVGRLSSELAEANVRVDVARSGDLAMAGDREKLAEVLSTVVRNSIDSMKALKGGDLRIRVAGQRQWVRVTVRDTGEIADPSGIQNIFVPYHTSRDEALGLGMTMARTLVESHGGTIEAAPAQGGGAVVTMVLRRKFV